MLYDFNNIYSYKIQKLYFSSNIALTTGDSVWYI